MDKFREECGVFGIFGHTEASNLTYLGLYALQHRGQESAGIAASDGTVIRHHKAMGYVNEAFNSDSLAKLPGTLAVGHVRYSTAGESRVANAHPIVVDSVHGQLGICHNGYWVVSNKYLLAFCSQEPNQTDDVSQYLECPNECFYTPNNLIPYCR